MRGAGNLNRASKGAAEIELAVLRTAISTAVGGFPCAVDVDETVVEPVIPIKGCILQEEISRSVEFVGAALGRKALDTGRGAAVLCRRRRGRD